MQCRNVQQRISSLLFALISADSTCCCQSATSQVNRLVAALFNSPTMCTALISLCISLSQPRSVLNERSLTSRDRRRVTSSSMNGSISGNRYSSERLQAINENELNYNSDTIKNSVQEQIEKMFTDITKDDPTVVGTFQIRYLGALPLTTKVTSLTGLQDPLRQLYLTDAGHSVSSCYDGLKFCLISTVRMCKICAILRAAQH